MISHTELDKNEGSIAIRNRLKASEGLNPPQSLIRLGPSAVRHLTHGRACRVQCAQVKVADEDCKGLKFDPKFWQLPEKSLHALFYVMAESDEGQKELESMKITELQAILLAYAPQDCDVPAPLQKPSGKGLRESLREAVVVAVAKVGADGEFQRYSRIRSVIPKKK